MEYTNNNPHKRQGKDTKNNYAKQLFNALYDKPISRRMAATEIGFTDQTYMVTQLIYDWIKQGKAQIVGKAKCSRSGYLVDKVTTNPDLFISNKSNQLDLF